MKAFLLILTVIVCYSHGFEILDIARYDSYTFDESDTEMPIYNGPLMATGGADTKNFIPDMKPVNIGFIEKNKIILIDDPKNEIYSFDSISFYNVTKNGDSFDIIKINAKMNNENYDIIIEINEGPNYDRTLNIYKNGKPHTLILLIENARLTKIQQKSI